MYCIYKKRKDKVALKGKIIIIIIIGGEHRHLICCASTISCNTRVSAPSSYLDVTGLKEELKDIKNHQFAIAVILDCLSEKAEY
jgi:hypothetical protein